MPDTRPIGLFDSGVGGLSVMREVVRQLPHEDVLYFADSAHCPYGAKSPLEIQRLSRGIVRFLLDQGAKLIVVACNTASAAALSHLRDLFDVPIVGMVPAVKPAASLTDSGVVGIIATEATFQGALFAEVTAQFAANVRVITQACPGLVERVERGETDTEETERLLRLYLEPLLAAGIDALVLGCTHYPFLMPIMRRIVGEEVAIIEPSPAIARQVRRVLTERDLLNPTGEGFKLSPHKRTKSLSARRGESLKGGKRFFTSGDPALFAQLLERLLGEQGSIFGVEWQGTIIVALPENNM